MYSLKPPSGHCWVEQVAAGVGADGLTGPVEPDEREGLAEGVRVVAVGGDVGEAAVRLLEAGQRAHQVEPTERAGVDALRDGDVEQLRDRAGVDLLGVAEADVGHRVVDQLLGRGRGGILAGARRVEREDGVCREPEVGVAEALEHEAGGDELLLEVVRGHQGRVAARGRPGGGVGSHGAGAPAGQQAGESRRAGAGAARGVVGLGEGAGSLGLGEVVLDGLSVGVVVGVGSAGVVLVGPGPPVVVADAVGPASAVGLVVGLAVGSANALVAGPPTSAAATSRVPARRNRAPRAVVGVDIGAFLSGSRRDARTTGSPGHSGSVPHSSTVLWSRSHLPGIPTRRDVNVATHGCGTVPDLDRLPPNRCVWCRPKATARLYSPRAGTGARVGRSGVGVRAGRGRRRGRSGSAWSQNGGGSWSWWCGRGGLCRRGQ